MAPIRDDSLCSQTASALPETTLKVFSPGPQGESPMQRLERLYRHPGGPLMGWLGDEASLRGDTPSAMSQHLGVTYGYLLQLCSGIRSIELISQEFHAACARYLGVPTIVCKVLSGSIRMGDFLHRADAEHEEVDRGIRRMMDDPNRRQFLPSDPMSLDIVAKRALVLMHTGPGNCDYLGLTGLPKIVQWLQRCAVECDDMSGKAQGNLNFDS